jgi:hypothetical protein
MRSRELLGTLTLAAALISAFTSAALAQNQGQTPDPTQSPPPAAPAEAAPTLPAPAVLPPQPPAPEKSVLLDAPSAGFANLMGPAVGHLQPRADYRVTWFPSEPVHGQPTNLGEERQDLSVLVPFWQDPANELSGTVHVRSELFQTAAILPNTGQAFPPDLWDIRFGATYRHLFDNGWIAGGGLNVGSASDKPFNGLDEMTMGLNAFLRIPQGEHNAWLFTLAYSPTGELAFPLPGVAYIWQPSDSLHVNVGLPFAVMYRPCDDLTFEFSYMLLRTIHARATYRLAPWLRLYGGYDWSNESYFLVDRPDVNDRFFYYDMRLSAGLQYLFSRQAILDLSAGYSFDRYYFESHQSTSQNFNRVNVGDGPFLSLRFEYRF